jgi:hypothetical protein
MLQWRRSEIPEIGDSVRQSFSCSLTRHHMSKMQMTPMEMIAVGAAIGGAIGTVVPVIGNAVGASIGGGIGAAACFFP